MTGKPRRKEKPDLDESAVELASLLAAVFHAGKKRGGEPAPELREAAERENLGPRHAPVLFVVALSEGLSVSELAQRVGLSVPTTSLLVGELSRAGLVARAEDERDRRRTLVTIPDELRDSVRNWILQVVEPMRRTLERLSPRAREDFLGAVRILAEESEEFAEEVGAREAG
jgi:DNA-binding MarR family transcriptional regulator